MWTVSVTWSDWRISNSCSVTSVIRTKYSERRKIREKTNEWSLPLRWAIFSESHSSRGAVTWTDELLLEFSNGFIWSLSVSKKKSFGGLSVNEVGLHSVGYAHLTDLPRHRKKLHLTCNNGENRVIHRNAYYFVFAWWISRTEDDFYPTCAVA